MFESSLFDFVKLKKWMSFYNGNSNKYSAKT